MILTDAAVAALTGCKPRASGDDPLTALDAVEEIV